MYDGENDISERRKRHVLHLGRHRHEGRSEAPKYGRSVKSIKTGIADRLTTGRLADKMMEYLDCECMSFMPMKDDSALLQAYREAQQRSNVFPVFVRVDAALMECMLLNSDPLDAGDDALEDEFDVLGLADEVSSMREEPAAKRNSSWSFDLSRIRSYRSEKLLSDLPDGAAYFAKLRSGGKQLEQEVQVREISEEKVSQGFDVSKTSEISKESKKSKKSKASVMSGGSALNCGSGLQCRKPVLTPGDMLTLASFWEFGTGMTAELILALIPVKEPWQIFAWIPFGGWGKCPDTEGLMAVSKLWYERYGAVPASISHDELEFLLPQPLSISDAGRVAKEQYLFCPDLLDSLGDGTMEHLTERLSRSRCWYFWWE